VKACLVKGCFGSFLVVLLTTIAGGTGLSGVGDRKSGKLLFLYCADRSTVLALFRELYIDAFELDWHLCFWSNCFSH
jgi:hypothetical protein